MAKIDLHMHSIFSCDGEYNPAQLLSFAKKADLAAVAVTDHNTTMGVDAAIVARKALNIEVVPAIELDCSYHNLNFHLLGYFIDHTSKKFVELGKDIRAQEIAAAKARINLDTDEALSHAKDGFVTGEIIAELVLNTPANIQNPLLRPYFLGGARVDNPYVNFIGIIALRGSLPMFILIICL
jgi:predicted metal-dependent phosphoesterase TrpH